MQRTVVRRIGGLAFMAVSLQLVLGASALPCTSMDHAVAGEDGPPSAQMAGMPMPDAGSSEHSGENCNEHQTVPACQSASACAVLAIPAAADVFIERQGTVTVPISRALTLISALTAPDQPPPRA